MKALSQGREADKNGQLDQASNLPWRFCLRAVPRSLSWTGWRIRQIYAVPKNQIEPTDSASLFKHSEAATGKIEKV